MLQQADVLIIGGGLSGALLAWQLLRQTGTRRVVIVERRAELGRGEAYSATLPGHTLNGNAARMSVDPDRPGDLTEWLTAHLAAGGWPQAHDQNVPVAELFPPRGLFGDYVRRRLAEAQAAAIEQGRLLDHVQGEVVDVQPETDGFRVTLADGQLLSGRRVVLATGMFPAARTAQRHSSGLNACAVDPWDVAAMRQLPVQGRVLIIGSGLTMVDALESLQQAGHRGPIRIFSRHGLLPQVRRQPPPWPDFLAADPTLRTPLQLCRALREQCGLAQDQGIDWQAPLDTVRAHIGRLWSQSEDRERRQFVRHLRPWWESHHHRSPPQGHALMARLQAEGRLSIEAAAFQGLEAPSEGLSQTLAVRVKRRGSAMGERVECEALINSSGIEYDWRRVDRPLPRQLLARGLVRPGPLALGIEAREGAVVGQAGALIGGLFALGPPLRGMWWESTAVTDVAAQAKALAIRLVAEERTESATETELCAQAAP
jgi:uncharacterized NAD(P)/FAD-binding protein YdhS